MPLLTETFKNNKPFSKKVAETAKSIWLANDKIVRLDLSALSACKSVTKIRLDLHGLTMIDLGPLTDMPVLEELLIKEGHDLAPGVFGDRGVVFYVHEGPSESAQDGSVAIG
jgi:hypothetical protein